MQLWKKKATVEADLSLKNVGHEHMHAHAGTCADTERVRVCLQCITH